MVNELKIYSDLKSVYKLTGIQTNRSKTNFVLVTRNKAEFRKLFGNSMFWPCLLWKKKLVRAEVRESRGIGKKNNDLLHLFIHGVANWKIYILFGLVAFSAAVYADDGIPFCVVVYASCIVLFIGLP